MKNLYKIFVLSSISIFAYVASVFILGKLLPTVDGPGWAGIWVVGGYIPTFIAVFIIGIRRKFEFNLIIFVLSTILFILSLYVIFFGFASDIGAKPLAVYFKSNSICNIMIGNNETCLRDVAISIGDDLACDGLVPGPNSMNFRDICYFRVAEKKLDSGLCDKSGMFRDVCLVNISNSLKLK